MKHFFIVIFISIVGLVSACQTEGEDTEERDLSGNTVEEVEKLKKIVPTSKDVQDVQKCYDAYKKAIMESNGKEAIKSITQSSVDYYGDILEWALNSSKSEVEKLDPVHQFMVLSVRKRIPKEQIKKMTGESLLIYTVDNEWTNKKTVAITELAEIRKIGDNTAKAAMTVRNENTDTVVEFIRADKDAEWKINLLSLSENVNGQLIRMASDRNETVGKLILDMIKQITNSSVSEDVWNPVN